MPSSTKTKSAVPAHVKQPSDHQPKQSQNPQELGDDVRLRFTRDGEEFISMPFVKAATNVAIVEQFPSPDKLVGTERMQYIVKVVLTSYRDDATALTHLRNMTIDELTEILDSVEEEEGLTVGESSGSSDS